MLCICFSAGLHIYVTMQRTELFAWLGLPSNAVVPADVHAPPMKAAVTTDSKHIVTTARVRTELVEAVDSAGGRASGAHLAVCQAKSAAKGGWSSPMYQ